MKQLFSTYPIIELTDSLTEDVVEAYKMNLEDAKEHIILHGPPHGLIHIQREIDMVNESPLKYHIEINIGFYSMRARYYNEKFSIN